MERPSPAVQDYLKAVFRIGESRGTPGPVTTSEVAEALAVTTASASNMLKRLDALGYVLQVKRQGVELTEAGRQAALEVIRHHRLLETYLATRLGMSWDEVHAEAEILEHHVSSALAARIAEALGHPERDPHGDPIPSEAGDLPIEDTERLSELPAGASGVVRRVSDKDDDLLRHLATLGLTPGAAVRVDAHGAFGGSLTVTTAEGRVDVSPEAAKAVLVHRSQVRVEG